MEAAAKVAARRLIKRHARNGIDLTPGRMLSLERSGQIPGVCVDYIASACKGKQAFRVAFTMYDTNRGA